MEDLLSTNIHGQPTNFGAVFHETTQRLDAAEVEYCLVGTLALGMYLRPRFTDDIDVLCREECLGRVTNVLAPLNGATHADKVSIRPTAAARPEALHALANRQQLALFGKLAWFASPLSLAWTFLGSDDLYADHDVAQLLSNRLVAADEIERLLQRHPSPPATARLSAIRHDLETGRYSQTYSDSVKGRLGRRTR